jgi:tetratricopeptide (TPR) repeat protein
MPLTSRPDESARWDALACVFVFFVTLLIYVVTLAPTVLPGDAGELISASRTLSIAHPPGYPLYLMLGKIFSTVFAFGSVAFRYNLMSAVLASAVGALVFLLARGLGAGKWAAMAVTLGIATRGAWWLQATGAEVYTLNAVFVVALLIIALAGTRRGDKVLVLMGLAGGLAISHHLSLVYALAAAVIGLLVMKVRPRLSALVVAVLFLALGLTVWLYIPIRAAQSPPLTYGSTSTFDGFISHITAQGYKWRVKPFDAGARLADFGAYIRLMFAQSGLWLSALAVLGLVASARRWRLLLGPLLVFVFYGIHSAAYNIPDIDSHVFPALITVGVFAALGAGFLAERSGRLQKAAGPAVLAAVSIVFIANLISLDGRGDEWFAHDYAMAAVESARSPETEYPMLVGSGSALDYPVLYASLVEGAPARVFVLGASNPEAAGFPANPRSLDECVEYFVEGGSPAEVALIGPVPPMVAGYDTGICAMVYTLDGNGRECEPPDRMEVRGRDGDERDYNSRLLSGTYHLHIARWHIASGDTAAARKSIDEAVTRAHDDVGTLIYASRLILELGLPREAFIMAEQAVAVDPDFFEAHNMLAGLYYLGGSIDQAIVEYEKALESNPNPAPVYSNLGNAYSRKRDYSTAMYYYREALSRDDSAVNAHIGLGIALAQTGNPDLGIEHIRTARDLEPYSPHPYHSEATVLMGLDRYDEAFGAIGAGLEVAPADANLLSDMGLAFLRTGDPDSAVVYFARALAHNPLLLTARGNLAVAYERTGDEARAREAYRKYLETAPRGPTRDRAAAELKRLEGL